MTIARLNAINREFYRVTADEFDATRGQAWLGWERLLPLLTSDKRDPNVPLSVLDVGCGNGRFGVFLREHGLNSRYHGMDNSPALLDKARAALPSAALELRDIVDNPPHTGTYDLVVLFGVLHHIPGSVERQAFMRVLAQRVGAGGMLAFACWRFYEYERFRARVVPWSADLSVEAHDYLLDWRRGARALRYCHYVDDAEHHALVAATGLREVQRYRADGEDGQANQYSVLRRE
ncbi:MAG: class I SAM-dependent methyltransferase [Anaerolineae bacterium]